MRDCGIDTLTMAGALAVATALAACATLDAARTPPEQTGPGPCRSAVCVILVSVKDCVATVDDPEKVVPRETRHPTIRFRLARHALFHYAFAEDGIAFKNDPGGQMRLLGRSFLAERFDIIDLNDTPGRYEYRIKVKRRFGETCPTLDPFIVNN